MSSTEPQKEEPKTEQKVAEKAAPKLTSTPPKKSASSERPDFLLYFLIVAVVFLGSYLVAIYNPTNLRFVSPRESKHSCDRGSWSLEHLPMKPVPRYKWEPSVPFTAQLAAWREPVILTNTFVNQWKAIERWTSDEYLRKKPELQIMNDTMVLRQCMMMPATKTNPLAKSGLVNSDENFWSLNATSDLFFSRFNNPNEDQYWYWYGKVEGSLRDDVQPNDFLWVDVQDQEQFGLYMWLSGPDIGPWWHYDQDHNFYVQVTGSKRFVLIPPWESSKMHPFPQIHPRNHKAQVNFDQPDFEQTPNYANVTEAYVAELVPGEVMYIPPYWWHHVRSHGRSLSLASWSQSGVYRVMRYGLYERKFAMDSFPPNSMERRAALYFLLKGIAETIYKNDSQFFKDLIQQRWDPIRAEIESNLGESRTSVENLCDFGSLTEESFEGLEQDIKESVKAFENCQTKVGQASKGIGIERRDMKAIRDLEFGDFTEFMLSHVIGAQNVLKFLDQCLSK